MNPLFLPNPNKEAKQGLERNKPLKKNDLTKKNDEKLKKDEEKTKANIPSNWYYNEKNSQQLWTDLEAFQANKFETPRENHLTKIDAATDKIRRVISTYEQEDQELLMKMAEINSPEGEMAIDDDEGIMMDARNRLFSLLDDHTDLFSQESHILDDVQVWFTKVKNGEDGFDILTDEEMKQYDVDSLKLVLDELEDQKSAAGDKVSGAYHSMIGQLTRKINDCKAIIAQKEREITELKEQNEVMAKKTQRKRAKLLTAAEQMEKLVRVQYQNADLKHQINQLVEERNLKDEEKRLLEMSTPRENLGEDDISQLILRNVELESQIQILNGQLNNAKDENKYLQQQMFRLKQSDMVQNTKLQTLQKQKSNLEKSLQNMTQKEELNKKEEKLFSKAPADDETVSKLKKQIKDMKKEYEQKIEEMKETERVRINAIQKDCDKKLKDNIKQFSQAFEASEHSAIIKETVELYNTKLAEKDKEKEEALAEQKLESNKKYNALITAYEELLQTKKEENRELKKKQEDIAQIRVKKAQLDYEEKLNQQLLETHQNAYKEYHQMYYELTTKVDHLKLEVKKLTRERNTMKAFLEANSMMMYIEEEEEEEENEEEDKDGGDDGFLSKSLQTLRDMELEKKLLEKYNLLMQTQMTMMKEQQEWEIENSKTNLVDTNKNTVDQFRQEIANMTKNAIATLNPESDDKLQDYFAQVIKYFNKGEIDLSETKTKQLMLPAEEVDFKMEEMRTKLLALLNENEIWKLTFDKLDGLQDKDAAEILDALKSAISDQAMEMTKLQNENQTLKKKVEKIEDSNMPSSRQKQEKGSSSSRSDASQISAYSARPSARIMRNMKRTRHLIFQVNPSTRKHFFVKLEGSPTLPEGKLELDCLCSNCNKDFIIHSKDIKTKTIEQPFVSCPKCGKMSQIIYVDEAYETGKNIVEATKHIKELEFRIRVLESNQKTPQETTSSNMRKKATALFVDVSTMAVETLINNTNDDDHQKKMLLETITQGLVDIQGTSNNITAAEILRRLKNGELSQDLIQELLKLLEEAPAVIQSISSKELFEGIPQQNASSSKERELPPLDLPHIDKYEQQSDDDDFKYTPQPSAEREPSIKSSSTRTTLQDSNSQKSSSISTQRKQTRVTILKKFAMPPEGVEMVKNIVDQINQLRKDVYNLKRLFQTIFKDSRMRTYQRVKIVKRKLATIDQLRKQLAENRTTISTLEMQLGRATNSLQMTELDQYSPKDLLATMNKLQNDYENKINEIAKDLTTTRDELMKYKKDLDLREMDLQRINTARIISQNVVKSSFRIENQIIYSTNVENYIPEIEILPNTPLTSGMMTPKSNRPSAIRGEKTPRMVLPKSKKTPRVYEQKPAQVIYYDPFVGGVQEDETQATSNSVVITNVVKEDNSNMKAGTNKFEAPPLIFPNCNISSNSSTQRPQTAISRPKTPIQNLAKESQRNTAKARINETATETMARRIQALEQRVQDYSNKLIEAKDHVHDLQTKQYRDKIETDKIIIELNKERMLHISVAKRLGKALRMIDEKNSIIEDLKHLNNKFTNIAAEITILHNVSKNDDSDLGKLMELFANTPSLGSMARNEMRSIQRWMYKRDKIVEKEKQRIMKVLDALGFILPEKGGHEKPQPLVQVTPMT